MNKNWKSAVALMVLLAVMAVSYGLEQSRHTQAEPLEIPVAWVEEEPLVTVSGALDALETFRQRRETQRDKDRSSLEEMIASQHTTAQGREDAQAALIRLVNEGEQERALEGAVTAAGFAPCLCVSEGDAVTVMVARRELTQGEANLLTALAQKHTGVEPENVIILTGDAL